MKSYLSYWTGNEVKEPALVDFKHFPVRCYFDNDSDELINFHGKDGRINYDVYRQMLKSLKGMGYNAIDIHDQLGRAEFYRWDSYKKYWNYVGDINHIEKLIDIIHEEGMLVQIPMYLAWAFDPIEESEECWSRYSQKWSDKWASYMNSTLGKGDIFLMRPRSPVYDSKYKCTCPACVKKGVGAIMTEAFAVIEKIILQKKTDAMFICDLYAEGYELWLNGSFKVSEKWLLMVADNGYGKLPPLHDMGKGNNKWGVYLHAGFWLNHTTQDPHLEPLMESVNKAYKCGATHYVLVNGQSFKNFILNLEAVMHMIYYGTDFSRKNFISSWSKRLFGVSDENLAHRIDLFIEDIAEAHRGIAVCPAYLDSTEDLDRGFTATMINVVYKLIFKINGTHNEAIPYNIRKAEAYKIQFERLLKESQSIELLIEISKRVAWNDQFTFPMMIMCAQLEFAIVLFEISDGKREKEEAKTALQSLRLLTETGSDLTFFKEWYLPEKSRRHHPIPDEDIFTF